MSASLRESQDIMRRLCQATSDDVRPEAAGLFTELVKQMRKLDTKTLRQLMAGGRSGPCNKAETYYRDALPLLGSTGAVAVIRDLVTSGQVSGPQADLLVTSITFIKDPSTEMMKELQSLVSADMERSSLAVSSVVNTYCKQNKMDSPEVLSIIRVFETELKTDCRADRNTNTRRMLLALRAIGNAGNAAHIAQTLNRCAMNDGAPMAVRVAAASAYRRISCDTSREELFRLYENKQMDSELRITAYLSVMQCVSASVIERVRRVLATEEINQVGSFVWTHLTNLAESSCPLKAEVSEIISDPDLLREFDVDKRKFSRNIEWSTFSELLNMGGSVDSNLIWSTGSYVPRSVNLNLTVDVFGQSVNLLEVGGRTQGLEEVLEKYFGPDSDISKRDRRAVVSNDVLSYLDSRYPKQRDTTQLSYYLRVFGNEIKSGDIFDFNTDSLKNKFNMADILSKLAQERIMDFTHSLAFLDSSIVVPTGVGLPLRVAAEGAITVSLKTNGKVDLRQMMANPSNFDVMGSIKPSAAVEIRAEFGVEVASLARTRLRVTNTMHTSTMVDGRVNLRNGQIFNAEWNMPRQKLEIFSSEAHFYISHRGNEREQVAKGQKSVQLKKCTEPGWSNKLGFEVCGELSYPVGTVIPRTGPAVVKLYVNKLDTFTSARLEASVIRNKNDQTDTARFSFTTPGGRVDRELTVDFKLDRARKDVSLSLRSPWKKVSVTGQLVDESSLKKVTLKALVDESREYSITAELAIADQKVTEVKYTPNVKVIIPGREPITLDGALTYVKGKKLSGNIAIRNALREPITADGSVELQDKRKSQKYDTNIQFSSPALRGSVSGFVTHIQENGNAWASRADINYQYLNGNKQRIVINHKLRDGSTANLKTYSTDGSWTTTMWPRYNGNFMIEEQYSATSVRTKIEAGFDSLRKIVIAQSGAFDVNGADKKLNGLLKFELPFKNWNYEVRLDHIHNPSLLQSNASIRYEENREHTLDVGVRRDATQYLSGVAEGRLKLAGRPAMIVRSVVIEKTPREYHNELSVDSGMGKTVRAVSVYKMGQRHELTSDVQATGLDPLNIKAHVNPNLKNMQVRAEIKYGRRDYMADISWVHRGTAAGFNTKAGAEVNYLTQNYGLSTELSRRNQDLTASLDAKCGDGRKVTFTSTLSINPSSPKIDLRVEWPQNFVSLNTAAKIEPDHWHQTTNDMELSAKLMTSLRGWEEMGGLLRIDVSPESFKSNGQVTWAKDRKIVADVMYDKSKAAVNIATPFAGYRTIKGDVSYQTRARNSMTGNARIQWESNQIIMSGTANHQRGRGYALTNSGELTINTPWRGYRVSKLTWNHQNDDGSMWKCHHELELDGNKKYIMDIDGTFSRVPGRSHQVSLKSSLMTPIQGYEQIAISFDLNNMYRMMIQSQGKAMVSLNRNTISLEHNVHIEVPSTYVVKAMLSTPYRGYESIGVNFDNRLNSRSNSYILKNEIALGDPQTKLNMDGTLMYNWPTFNTAIRIVTPYDKLPRILFNVRNGRQPDNTWAFHGDLEYSPDKTINMDAKLSVDRTYGLEVSASSPFDYLRMMSGKALANVRSYKSFDVTTELTHNMMRDKIRFDGVVELTELKTGAARVSAQLVTPFSKLSVAKLVLTHAFQPNDKCQTNLAYELNEYRGQLTHDQTVRSAANFEGKTKVEYLSGRVINFEHRVSVSGSKSIVRATLTTPFSAVHSLDFSANMDGVWENFKAAVEMTHNRRDKTALNVEHLLDVRGGAQKSSLRLTTPYSVIQRLTLTHDTTIPKNDMSTTWTATTESALEYNTKRWYVKREAQYDNGVIKVIARAETPYDSFKTSEFKLTHTPRSGRNGNGWSNSMSYELNGKRYTAESEYIWVLSQLRAKLVLNVPDEYSVVVNHKADRNDVNCGIVLKAGSHATGSASFKMNPSLGIELKATVDTPYRNYEKYDFTFKHEGPVSDFRTTATLSTPSPDYRNIVAILTYKGNPNDFTSTLQIETPFKSIPKILLSANHRLDDRSGLDSGASLVYSDNKRIAATVNFKNDGRTSRATASITTPFKGYESLTGQAEHTGSSWRQFRTNASLRTSSPDLSDLTLTLQFNAPSSDDVTASAELGLPRGKVGAKYSHAMSRASGDLRCSIEVTSPYRNYEKFTALLEHQGGATTPHTKITVTTSLPGYETFTLTTDKSGSLTNLSLKAELTTPINKWTRSVVSWTHTATDSNVDVKAELRTSYPGYERMTTSLAHTYNRRGLKSQASLDTSIQGYRRFAYNIDHSLTRKNLKTTVSIETPFSGYDKFSGSVEYQGLEGDAFKASVDINTPIQGYKSFGASINHSGMASQFETTGSIKTPFTEVKQIDYALRHRGQNIRDFATSLSAEYSGKKIQLESSFKLSTVQETNYEGTLRFVSPCPYIRDLLVSASHVRKPSVKSGTLLVTYNSEKKVDLDYSYTTEGNRNVVINLRDPYTLSTNLNMADSLGSAVLNWDPNDDTKKIRFDFGLKNIETSAMTERYISFKTIVPRRVVGFSFGYSLTPEKFTNRAELLWDSNPSPDFVYEIEMSKMSSRSQPMYNGRVKVSSALVNVDTTFSHKSTRGKHVTEIGLQTTDKLTIKNDLTFNGDKDFTHSLSIQHPRYVKDFNIVTETKNGNSFTTTLKYDRQSATLEGQLIDESRGSDSVRYSGKLRLAHPNSITDIQLGGEVYADSEKFGGSLVGQYQTMRDRQMKIASLKTEINRLRHELMAEITTPIDSIKLSALNREYNDDVGIYRYDVTATLAGTAYKSTLDLSAKDRSADIKLYTNNVDYIELFGQFYSPTQSVIELTRVTRGQKLTDAKASIALSDERIITGHALLRPGLMQEIQSFFSQLSRDQPLTRSIQASADRFNRAYQEEMSMKKRYWQDALEPIRASQALLVSDFNSKIDEIQSAFGAAFRRNEFYMRDIYQALKRHYDDLSRRMQYKMVEMQRNWEEVKERMRRTNRVIAEKWNELSDSLERQTRPIRMEINERMQLTKQLMDRTSQNIRNAFMESLQSLRRQPWYQKLASMQPSDWLALPSQLMQTLRAKYDEYMYKLDYLLEQTGRRPELLQFRETVLQFIQQNQWMYEYLGLDQQKVTEFMYKARAMTLPMIKAQIQQSLYEFFKWNRNKWTVWEPRRGEYAFEVYMPVDLPDLTLLQRLDITPYLSYVYNYLMSYLPDDDWTLLDTIYAYKPKSDVRDWVPPFKAHATLVGSQHYMTFDKQFYEFAGECSYLLARDFLDKTFSVIVNYDKAVRGQATKKSLTVVSDDKQIEIFPDGRVSLEGQRSELPLRIGNTTVSRHGNTITVTNQRGVEVSCDLPHDHCTVAVSGWYYGKTAGLLGTYDNEPYNDMSSIDKTQVEKPELMADSWTVGSRCRPVNRASVTPLDENTRRYRACAKYFIDETSPFRSCFRIVSPEPFLTMCVNDVPAGDNSLDAQNDICRTSAAYIHECRRQEVHIRTPTQCVRCEVPFTSDKFYEGETKSMSGSDVPKTADVVFVVQHASCNSDVIDKIRNVIDDLDKALKADGLKNSQFAVVGFGGQGHLSTPSVRTMDGQIFNSANKVTTAFNRFDLQAGGPSDVMQALKYAARLPFRAGASKSIVLVACESCREETLRYSEMQRVLIQLDIHLHTLVNEQFALKSKSPKTALIFGVDDETVYTSKDVSGSDLYGEADLRKYVRLPKDLCVALTIDTKGSVFSARQRADPRPAAQKRFSDVWVRTLARKATPTDCQVCECVGDETGTGVSQCSSCTPRNPIYSLMPNFAGEDFTDVEVAQISKPSGSAGKPDFSSEDGWITAAPKGRTTRPPVTRVGDKVTRRRPVTPARKIPPTVGPAQPKVKDQ